WLKTNLAKFSRMLQGQRDLTYVGRMILSELAPVVSAQHAVFYVVGMGGTDETRQLTLLASYAAEGLNGQRQEVQLGEGLIGQCALEKRRVLLTVPPDYISIRSGLGQSAPRNLLVLPVVFEGEVKGVIELASFESFSAAHETFLEQLMESIGIVLNTIAANMRTEHLLQQSQTLATELQSRQEELQKTNEELQEKARLLAHQNEEVERKNREVEQARQALEEKAKQLALTSKYKSEFLANMSHELRTPLNSLLILSDQLSKNPEGNLTPRQREFAKTIHSSGNDLLMLINDILDLSKIESGKVFVEVAEVRMDDLRTYVERTFRHVAEAKNLNFSVQLDRQIPVSVFTDVKRLQQVLKNLLSNAFKFTQRGHVTLTVAAATHGWSRDNHELAMASRVIAFSVHDTGIGIPSDKQQIIFEAFQQADGSTSRKYGGTGLGLAISRELAHLLGGEIRLTSTPGKGSVFTLYLPESYAPRTSRKGVLTGDAQSAGRSAEEAAADAGMADFGLSTQQRSETPAVRDIQLADLSPLLTNEVGDDRDTIGPTDSVVVIVENDLTFARLLMEAARENGFKVLATSLGAAALALVREHRPGAVTLDIVLPDVDGWRVLERLKNDLQTRHIPVCIISTEDVRDQAQRSGAFRFVSKPIRQKEVIDQLFEDLLRHTVQDKKKILLVGPDTAVRRDVTELIVSDKVEIQVAENSEEMLGCVGTGPLDCLIVLEEAGSMNPSKLAEEIGSAGIEFLPVLLYAEGEADSQLDTVWKPFSDYFTIRHVHSPERLVDQIAFFLHTAIPHLPKDKQEMILALHQSDGLLSGKRVLIVDDDMRNIFALSAVLEEHQMEVFSADNGADAIKILRQNPELNIVLMDIMMPEMDGMETIQGIRKIPELRNIPIIAVTAKAMKGDRERCIEAGAWDYLAKPVDTAELLAVLRAWLYR
ncbi:MAG: response regulator, partial [Acidobacteria bacterium]